MTKVSPDPAIDWGSYHEQLKPFLAYGGVVYVRGGPKAPLHIFDHRLVTDWLSSCPERTWTAVRLSPKDSGTQYRADIVALIAEALSVELPVSQSIDGVKVLSDNRALIFRAHDINMNLYAGRNRDLELTQLKHLVRVIRELPEGEGLALIVVEGDRWERTQRERLYTELWRDHLGGLGQRILLIVLHVKDAFSYEVGSFPPRPSAVIELDDFVEVGGASGDSAILDVAAHAISLGWHDTEDAAIKFAEAMVLSCENMTDLYYRLTVYQVNRGREMRRHA